MSNSIITAILTDLTNVGRNLVVFNAIGKFWTDASALTLSQIATELQDPTSVLSADAKALETALEAFSPPAAAGVPS